MMSNIGGDDRELFNLKPRVMLIQSQGCHYFHKDSDLYRFGHAPCLLIESYSHSSQARVTFESMRTKV